MPRRATQIMGRPYFYNPGQRKIIGSRGTMFHLTEPPKPPPTPPKPPTPPSEDEDAHHKKGRGGGGKVRGWPGFGCFVRGTVHAGR